MWSSIILKENVQGENVLFRWKPNMDVAAALISLLFMWASFYYMYHSESITIKFLVFGIFANVGLSCIFPILWTVLYRKERIDELGITTVNWMPSLVIGTAAAYIYLYRVFPLIEGIDWLPAVVCNSLLLWEPLFLFGWLQSRFEKSFGVIPGVIFAGLSLGIYHIGSFELSNAATLMIDGIVFAALYRTTRNLLIMWPVLWSVNAVVGTLTAKMEFDWSHVAGYVIVLSIQVIFITYVYRKERYKAGFGSHNSQSMNTL